MLHQAIAAFPEPLWIAGEPNSSWRIAYHALFFTDLYLSPASDAFVAWEKHRSGSERFTDATIKPYAKAEVLEYCDGLNAGVNTRVRALALDGASGFDWLTMTRLEVHLYNLRHLAHHEGQLADRLRVGSGLGVPWTRRGDLAPDR